MLHNVLKFVLVVVVFILLLISTSLNEQFSFWVVERSRNALLFCFICIVVHFDSAQ
ncbi:MAG: hypothetical protein GX330_05235 [Bacteroidales bacterium]|nr:hypothetical protein [Bacteroidales bacterium]